MSARYLPGSGSDGGAERRLRGVSHLTAPFGGSRLVFPARLAGVLDPARRERACRSLSSTHARWFFGDALVLWTDPQQLTARLLDRVQASDGTEIRLAERFVDDGDWTDVIVPAADLAEHQETVELVEYRANYPAMPSFAAMLKRIRSGGRVRRYRRELDTEDKLHGYFRYFLALIESIEAEGLREHSSFRPRKDTLGATVRGRYAGRQRDIGAAVDETGRLLRFLGGRHRTAIAQALGLRAVPVEIRIVHAEWLAAEAGRSGLPPCEALRRWAARASLPPPGTAKLPLGASRNGAERAR